MREESLSAPVIFRFVSPRQAAEACGARTFALLNTARDNRGNARLAVSGGSTPRIMFEWMATQNFDWSGVDIFQVDERCFPPDDPQSNYRMLRESLLDHIRIHPSQIHRVRGELKPAEAAEAYRAELASVFGEGIPVFDVIQRGMGNDAHTASLFPGEPAIENRDDEVAALWVEKMGQYRVTLLRAPLERARATLCLVTGADKASPFRKVIAEPFNPVLYPAQIASGRAEWFVDEAATPDGLFAPAIEHR